MGNACDSYGRTSKADDAGPLTSATGEFPISDHPKCKGLVVAYGRSSLTRVGPQGRNFLVNLGWGGIFILKK